MVRGHARQYEFAHYEPWQRERVNGLPGLTGYWQVNGKNKTTFNEMIMMDRFYLENMSVLLDLKIMLKTSAVIAGQLLESKRGHNAIGSGANVYKACKRRCPNQRPRHRDPNADSKPIARLRPRFKTMDCDRHASKRMTS